MRPIKRWFRRIPFITSLSAVIVVSAPSPGVQAQPAPPADLQAVSPDALPLWANWYPLQYWNSYPPFPANWCAGRTDVAYYLSPSFGTNNILVDDPLAQVAQAGGASPMDQGGPPPLPSPQGGGGSPGPGPTPPQWSPGTNLYLEIFPDTNYPGMADIRVFNATNASAYYELVSTTNLSLPPWGGWTFGPALQGSQGTNTLWFVVPLTNAPVNFYQVVAAVTNQNNQASMFYLLNQDTATEPSTPSSNDGVDVGFQISLAYAPTAPLTVFYSISGSAVDGVDYTNLPGAVTFATNQTSTNVYVHPNWQPPDFDKYATFTLVPTNVAVPPYNSVSITIQDANSSNVFAVVATNLPWAEDIDYYAPSNCLVLPVNYVWTYAFGLPCNFVLLDTNHNVRQWSSVTNVGDGYTEIKIATVRTSTNGFVSGQLFFGNCQPGGIGLVSAYGNSSAINWLSINGETQFIEGDLYLDQTGIWGNDLLAVTGIYYDCPQGDVGPRNIWRIGSNGSYTLVASITECKLEGLLTVPLDPRYGPWAGALVTASETSSAIYSVTTNGAVSSWGINSGPGPSAYPIAVDTLRLIPTNQPLYVVDYQDQELLKIPAALFNPYVGDILAVQSGESGETANGPCLFILQWNPLTQNFDVTAIPFTGHPWPVDADPLEKAAFAPVDISPVIGE